MTEQQAEDLRRAAWRINSLCARLGYWNSDHDTQELIRLSRDSASRLREMAGPVPVCNGNGG